jgi:hypothetical protein
MFEIIEKVRQKKDREKKIIAFSVSFFICSVIFIFWLFTVLPGFQKQVELDKKVSSAKKGPTENLAGFVTDNYSQVRDQINKIKSISNFFKGDSEYFKAESTLNIEQEESAPVMIFSSTTIENTP